MMIIDGRLYCPRHEDTIWVLPGGRCPICDAEVNWRQRAEQAEAALARVRAAWPKAFPFPEESH